MSQDAPTHAPQPSQPEQPAQSKGLASFGGMLGAASPWPAVVGILAIQAGVARPLVGFYGFFFSLLLAIVAVLACAAALLMHRNDANAAPRRAALGGLAYGAVVLVAGVVAAAPGAGAPAINDITTDLANPPKFSVLAIARENRSIDLSYPPEFISVVREAYPDLAGVELKVPAYIALYRASRVASELDWEVVGENFDKGTLEARVTSRIFRFVDDVVVRVLPVGMKGEYSIVDVRSRSRDGRGDLGANATRIREFFSRL